MADIRIKDLTTTASSTASDDFIAVDGTTNGTRKLSAFSPTFGGNATVGGTLTVAALVTANGGANVVTSGFTQTQTGNELRFSRNGFNYVAMDGGTSANIRFLGTTTTAGDTGILNLSNTQVAVLPTTASTTTSSGALVVSGGVGVAGAIFAGQSVSVVQSLADNNGFRVINTNTAGLPGLYLEGDGSEYALIRRNNSTAGNPRRVEYIATGSGANHYFNTNTIVGATTASTSTSSGALVVSGGVGVAGAMNVGGSMKLNYFSTAGDPTALGVVQLYATTNTTSGAGGIEWKADAGGNGYGYRTLTVFDGVSAYDLYTQVRTNSASWTNSVILKSNGNATFSGSVQTSAPSGGTAAAWKLGTVATVSPTSPNRTIEVDIGGTIYYIHAKTTNN